MTLYTYIPTHIVYSWGGEAARKGVDPQDKCACLRLGSRQSWDSLHTCSLYARSHGDSYQLKFALCIIIMCTHVMHES